MAKCTNCLRKAVIDTTGTNPQNTTLIMDIGGAVLYVMPHSDGTIEVILNTESLTDGDYAVCNWNGNQWKIARG